MKEKTNRSCIVAVVVAVFITMFAILSGTDCVFAQSSVNEKHLQEYMDSTLNNDYNWGMDTGIGVNGTCTGAVRQALKDAYKFEAGKNVINYNRDILEREGNRIISRTSLSRGTNLNDLRCGDICLFYGSINDTEPFHQGIIYDGKGKDSILWHNTYPRGVIKDRIYNILNWYPEKYNDVYVDVYRMDTAEDNSSESTEDNEPKNGFVNQNGRTYYYVNGEKQRGIQNIEGNYYYFDWNDYSLIKQGWLHFWPYDNDVYTDKVDGHFHMGLERVSEGSSRDGTYYFDPNNMGLRYRGLKTIDGETYYFDWNSYKIKTGLIYFGGYNKRYAYANLNTGAFTKGRANIDGKTYYFRKDGFSARGIVTDNGRDYYYDWNKYTLVKQGLLYFWPYENYVYTDYDDGHFVKGWKKIGADNYYFSKENGHMCHEITKVDNKFYYFGSKSGKLYKDGWLYFWPYKNYAYADRKDGHLLNGPATISEGNSRDGSYFFGTDGLLKRGLIENDGNLYYYDWNDRRLFKGGWIYFNPYKNYGYADRNTGELYRGLKTVNETEKKEKKKNGTYYFSEDGLRYRGLKDIDGETYYFDWDSYKLFNNGWIYFGGYNKKWSYTDAKGAFYKGIKIVGEKEYNFGDNGFVDRDDLLRKEIDGQWYLVSMDGSYKVPIEENHKSPSNSSRDGNFIDRIIIHHWGNPNLNPKFDSVVSYLCRDDDDYGTSAHYVVEDGRVACIVNEGRAAWHAGIYDVNQRSIGIECRPYATEGDYKTVSLLVADIWKRCGKKIPLYGHKDVVPTQCPGRWNLSKIERMAEAWL